MKHPACPGLWWFLPLLSIAALLCSGAMAQEDNIPSEGFTALFNGKNLAGWKGLVKSPPARGRMSCRMLEEAQRVADVDMRRHWSVEDGVIVFDGKGQSLCTVKDYGDFELLVDWKIPPEGDSGIYLRGSPQVQIWVRDEGSGGLYNNQKNPRKPIRNADRPPGEWNRFRIRMIGEKVTVHLNGELVVDHVIMENYWERNKPIYPLGAIELQNHGGPLFFRNIFVREIPRALERIGIVDIPDHWLKVKGLGQYLEDRGIPYRDLTEEVRQGALKLDGLDALIIGTFATSEPALHEGLDQNAAAIHGLLERGGVVVEFTQADQEQDWVGWLPDPLKARRCDADHARRYLPDPGHPLFAAPAKIDGTILYNCAMPQNRLAWETFSEHLGFAILAAANSEGDNAFILEGQAGKGRVLLLSMTPDKTYTSNEPLRKASARDLLDNIIAYIQAAPTGCLPTVEPDDILPPADIRVRGTVYEDQNGNGKHDTGEPMLEGIRVSNGIDIVKSDGEGRFRLEMPLAQTRCIFPVIPAEFEVPGNVYARIPEREQKDQEVVFGLKRREGPPPEAFTFLQATDIHIGRLALSYLAEDVAEINRIQPAPDLVFSTGDLVDTGSEEDQYLGYKAAMAALKPPLINVIGNHDYNGGTIRTRNWEKYLGPRYFSFEYGTCHMLCLDSIAFDDIEKAWIEKDLALVPEDRPVLIFQHYLPDQAQLDLYARHHVKVVFSGHWHGTREVRYQGVMNINSATLRFGGIDRTPRGFRVVRVQGEEIHFDYRVGGLYRHMAIVSPAPGSSVPRGRIPVVVNAYDTALPPHQVVVAIRDVASPGKETKPLALTADGDWTWFGMAEAGEPGERLLLAEVTDDAGRTWRAWSSFHVGLGRPAVIELGADWPMFHGDARNTGQAEAAEIKLPLSLVWAAPTGGGVNAGSPVVADGNVYIGTLFTHGFDACGVVCLDARTGNRLWHAQTDSSIKHAPCTADGRVFAASVAGTLYAFDAAWGKTIWTASLAAEDAQRWDTCAPKCVDGVVYAGRGGYFAALDAATGEEIWKVEAAMDQNWWPNIYAAPAVGGSLIYLGSQKGLHAVERGTGRLLWHVKGRAVSPVLAGDRLYALLGNSLAAVDPASGEVLWRKETSFGDETGCPALAEGDEPFLYIGGAGGTMQGFRLPDGGLAGSFAVERGIASMRPYQRGERTITSSPAVAGDLLVFGGNDGYLYILDRKTLVLRQRYYLGAPIPSSPAVSGNAVFIAALDGNVYAFASAP